MTSSIADRLNQAMKDAMRAKDTATLNTIRQVKAKVQAAANAPDFSGEVDDALHQKIIGSYSKMLAKSISELSGPDPKLVAMREQYQQEIDYLAAYLPKTLSEEETRKIVTQAIAENGVTDAKGAGKLVG